MKDRIKEVIEGKLADALHQPFPDLVRRDAHVTTHTGKVKAVIGMRRAGKTSFLFQMLRARLASGVSRDRLIYFNFEDERLADMRAEDLELVIESYYRQFSDYRMKETVVWCFDEIQVIAGWERFVRRLLDSERVEIFISGSSARMLSREVATSLRGRAMETVITPFSWREFLRLHGAEPKPGKQLFASAERSRLESLFEEYLAWGGFPENLEMETDRERVELLQGYVDIVLLRDIGERHGVGNLVALRAFVRQLLRHPAQLLSVSKTYRDFQSRGISVAKGTLLEYLEYLEDAFLVFSLPLAVGSERRRQTNPRKLYVADHGLARAYAANSGLDRGRMLENIMACALKWRCRDLGYLLTDDGLEVDFLARTYGGETLLVQVAADISELDTWQREIRALESARADHAEARCLLITESKPTHRVDVPEWLEVSTIWRWLLE